MTNMLDLLFNTGLDASFKDPANSNDSSAFSGYVLKAFVNIYTI